MPLHFTYIKSKPFALSHTIFGCIDELVYIISLADVHKIAEFNVIYFLTDIFSHAFIWRFEYRQNHNIVNLFSWQLIWIFSLGYINVQKSFYSRLTTCPIYLFYVSQHPTVLGYELCGILLMFWFSCCKDVSSLSLSTSVPIGTAL